MWEALGATQHVHRACGLRHEHLFPSHSPKCFVATFVPLCIWHSFLVAACASLDRPFCGFSPLSVWHRWAALCHARCLLACPVVPWAPGHAVSAQTSPVRRESAGSHTAEQLLVPRASHCVPTEAALPDEQCVFLPPPSCLFIHMYPHQLYYSAPSAGAVRGCKYRTRVARFIACFVLLIPSKVLGM